jgi:hypothetical protein
MPENIWVEVGVLCKTMKEKHAIIEALKRKFQVKVTPVGRNSKRRWLEATVFMENMMEVEAVDEISKLLKGTSADGWLDVWVHSFSRHITAGEEDEQTPSKQAQVGDSVRARWFDDPKWHRGTVQEDKDGLYISIATKEGMWEKAYLKNADEVVIVERMWK